MEEGGDAHDQGDPPSVAVRPVWCTVRWSPAECSASFLV